MVRTDYLSADVRQIRHSLHPLHHLWALLHWHVVARKQTKPDPLTVLQLSPCIYVDEFRIYYDDHITQQI